MRRNPIKLNRALTSSQVSVYRHPFCNYENKCLNKAVKKRWKGFSCEKCSFFRKYKKSKQEEHRVHVVYMQEVWNKNYIL